MQCKTLSDNSQGVKRTFMKEKVRLIVKIDVRMSEELHDKIKREADNRGMSVGALSRFLIEKGLKKG